MTAQHPHPWRSGVPIECEPSVEDAMIAALVRFVQYADRVAGDAKYCSIKWGIHTAQGYTRHYADAVAAILRYHGGEPPAEIEIDPIAVEEIGAYLRSAQEALPS